MIWLVDELRARLKESLEDMACEVVDWSKAHFYETPLETKYTIENVDDIPSGTDPLIDYLHGQEFLLWLENFTSISGLIIDPHLRGAGLHVSFRGGNLGLHFDSQWHPRLKLQRALSAIVFLTPFWEESWGGALQFWECQGDRATRLIKEVFPVLGRMVLFTPSTEIVHGYPDPLRCPPGVERRTLAIYYYVAPDPNNMPDTKHSTRFVHRPGDPDSVELQELRRKRWETVRE